MPVERVTRTKFPNSHVTERGHWPDHVKLRGRAYLEGWIDEGGAGKFPGNSIDLEKLRAEQKPRDLPGMQDMNMKKILQRVHAPQAYWQV